LTESSLKNKIQIYVEKVTRGNPMSKDCLYNHNPKILKKIMSQSYQTLF